MPKEVTEYKRTNSLLNDVKAIIETGLHQAYQTTESIAVYTYWNIGKRIVEEEQEGKERAKILPLLYRHSNCEHTRS